MTNTETVSSYSFAAIGVGVWWYVWGIYGFAWGVLYGVFWQIWVGYRLALYLLGIHNG